MTDFEERSRRLRRAVDAFERSAGGGGIRLTINDDGPADRRGFDRVFVGLEATIDAFPQALRAALPAIRAGHAQNFRSESSGFGGWAPLAPATQRQRARLGYGAAHPILVRTGQLRGHVLTAPARISRVSGGFELRIAPSPSVGGRPKYVANARGTSRIPARPMVSLTPQASTAVTSAISRFLRNRLAGMT